MIFAANDTSVQQLTHTLTQSYSYALVAALISPIILLGLFFGPRIFSSLVVWKVTRIMRKLSIQTDRNVLVMSHRSSGILFGSMINMEDVIHIEKILRKMSKTNAKGVDFIINTFGGDLYASMRLALLVKNHPDIRIIIPKYAWSGGTLTALAAKKIVIGKSASLSPVDPQLGTLWKFFSSKYWEEIVKRKGNKASDDSIAMDRMSKEIMAETGRFLTSIMSSSLSQGPFFDRFLTGERTHGDQVYFDELKSLGLPVEEKTIEEADEIIEKAPISRTVFAYTLRKK